MLRKLTTKNIPRRYRGSRYYAVRIDKVLIANRGEIACRVIRTAKKLGIKTVAVYSEADANSMHVALADESYCIGPAAAKDSYLRGDKIIDIAKKTGALAIHPGYGFLSENEDFAKSVEDNKLIFIGPPGSAIRDMGSKSASKDIMSKANVPVIPGYHGKDQSLAKLTQEAAKIGYPVLLKAVHGGGGKGMRIVTKPEDLAVALESCQREAQNSFGNNAVLVEKYITRPRHIEIQVFADTHGNVVYLYERDCSVQRRHQKIIEEAPGPGITPELRKQMGEAACNAARAVGYRGAGTVEFILDLDGDNGKGKFYFMEMNTRLQVEHPVTEMITRQDLVHWQLQVAEGKPLPLKQEQIPLVGHAFEARIYAENPDKGFLPGIGTLEYLSVPPIAPGAEDNVRIDTGVRQGDQVSVFYDPMIAKLIVWDANRDLALRRLIVALENYSVAGLHTNIDFLIRLASHKQFQLGDVHTGFIPKHFDELGLNPKHAKPVSPVVLALANLAQYLEDEAVQLNNARNSLDPYNPWASANALRVNHLTTTHSEYKVDEIEGFYKSSLTILPTPHGVKQRSFVVEVSHGNQIPTRFNKVTATCKDGSITAIIDGVSYSAVVVRTQSGNIEVIHKGKSHTLAPNIAVHSKSAQTAGSLNAPMPGKVVKVFTKAGATVKKGEPLLILEAMKMEHMIASPRDGVVKSVFFNEGEQVKDKATLISIE